MEVIRAKHAGVCYGVERALDMAHAAMLDDKPTYTLGPLTHNPRFFDDLASHGVHVAKTPEDVREGIVIIRSHGVEPEVLETLKARNLTVIDATCPHVAKAQRSAAALRDMGGTVIVVGRADHPEVRGLCGHAGDKVVVVASPDELPERLEEPVGVVVQTTESAEKLDAVVEGIRYEICRAHCERAHFVEDVAELDPAWFAGCETVGVTAGASTPADQIQAVVECLEAM